MAAAGSLLVGLLVGYLPGLALLWALGLRRPLLLVALAPAASVALAGLVAVVVAVAGVPYGPLPVALVVFLVAGATVLARLWRRGAQASEGSGRVRTRRSPTLPAQIVGTLMTFIAVIFASWTWLHGMGGLRNPPQEHDTIIHAMMTAYIMRSGHAAPWQLVPADVLTGQPVSFYPSGLHLLAALTADLDGGVVIGLNVMTVVFLAVALCTGTAALTAIATRQLGLASGGAALAGGVAALVMAGMARPAFHLMNAGGILGNASALAVVPGVVAGVLCLPSLRARAAAGVGMAAGGAAWIHPSAAVSIGVTVLAWWAGQVVSPWGRRTLRGLVRPLGVAAVAGVVVLVPAVAPGLGAAGRTGAFPPDTAAVSLREAVGSTFGFPFAGWLDTEQARSQVWVVVLLALGVLTVVALRRGLGPVAAWACWSAIVLGAWLSPGAGLEAPITGFFYNAMLRTWSHVSLLAAVIAGIGVVLVADRAAVLVRRRVPLRATLTATSLALLAFTAYAAAPAVSYASFNEQQVATRYRTPDFTRVDADDERAIAWLAQQIRPGQRVFNSPNDGSTYLYVEAGIPVVNVYTLGLPGVPYSYRLLEDFNRFPFDSDVRRQLVDLNVRWVYVDSEAPGIGSVGSPENWAGDDGFTLAPGLRDLDGLPGLDRAFRSGSVTVYSLDTTKLTAQRP